MKLSIRSKLIFSFLSLLIIPLIVVVLTLLVLNGGIFNVPLLENVAHIDTVTTDIVNIFEANHNVEDLTVIDEEIAKQKQNYFNRVLYVDTDGNIRYDSEHLLAGKDISELIVEEVNFLTYDVISANNIAVGKVMLQPTLPIADALDFILFLPTLIMIIFIVTIMAMMLILSKILSDGILKPLRELNAAADRISSGDLDFEMTYKKDDELGKLCIEFDRMRHKLKNSLDRQEKYEQSRKLLLASVSHDLRTPLTSVKGYVEALQDGIITDEGTKERYMQVIMEHTNKLNELIDDLFIFSKMELGEFKIDVENISSDFLLESLLLPKEMEFKDTNIEYIIDKHFPEELVRVDKKRIGQVVDNIIHNASKFTNSYIKVYTDVEKNYLRIFIEDDGIGIPKDELPFIFDQFYKVDKSRTSTSEGTGLGLAISKKLVIAHRGRISVKSEMNEGTTFKIELPIIQLEQPTE